MKKHLLLLTLIAALGAAGCFSFGDDAEESGDITSEGVDAEKDPLGALGAIASLGSDLENLQQELDDMPEVDPLHFSELIKALPDPPEGWSASKPKGETTKMANAQISQASRIYTQNAGGGRTTIKISDWAFHKMVYLPFIMSAKFSQESTDGYSKGIEIGDDPGREEYEYDSQNGSRTVLYHKRYHVQIDINQLPQEAFRDWWDMVNLEHLPAVK